MRVSSGSAAINVGTQGTWTPPEIDSTVDLVFQSNTTLTASAAGNLFELAAKLTGSGTLTKAGPGTVEIRNGSNDWSGGLNIQSGRIEVTSSNALGSGAVTVGSGSTLDLNLTTQTIISLTGSGQVLIGPALTITGQSSNSANSFVGTAGANTLTITLSAAATSAGLNGSTFSDWTDGVDQITINGNGLANEIYGSAASDTIFGMDGNDTINGHFGNDSIYGGNGIDTAVYNFERGDYSVFTFNNGSGLVTRVSDALISDGTDLLVGVEKLRFDTTDFNHNGAQLNRSSNVAASRFDDVIFHSDTTGQSYGYIMNLGGVASHGALSTAYGGIWDAIDSGDMNGDGRADIIYRNSSNGSLAFGLMTAAGVGSTPTLTTSLSTTYRFVGVQDMDGDAWLDVVIQNTSNGIVYVGDMTGTTHNGWTAVSNEGTLWRLIGMGDTNGDGRADYVYQHQGNGFISAGLANASGGIASYQALTGGATLNWFAKEVADVNRDGYADVLIQNGSNGDISYINMANGVATSFGTVMNGFGTAWQLEGMSDTNNDGDLDAIIRNVTGSSDTYVVNMQNGAFQSFTLVAQGIGSQWYVV